MRKSISISVATLESRPEKTKSQSLNSSGSQGLISKSPSALDMGIVCFHWTTSEYFLPVERDEAPIAWRVKWGWRASSNMNLWPTCLRVRMLDTLAMGGGESSYGSSAAKDSWGFVSIAAAYYLWGELTTLLLGKPWDFCYFHVLVGVSPLLDSRKLSSEFSNKKRLWHLTSPILSISRHRGGIPAGNQANESSPASTMLVMCNKCCSDSIDLLRQSRRRKLAGLYSVTAMKLEVTSAILGRHQYHGQLFGSDC